MDDPKKSGLRETYHGFVLIVNRDLLVRDWLEQNVQALGYEAEWAPDEGAALDVLRLAPGLVRAILVDVTIPSGEGAEILQAIRAFDRKARIIAFGGPASFDHRIPLAVLPASLDQKSLEIALHLVVNMYVKGAVATGLRRGEAGKAAAA